MGLTLKEIQELQAKKRVKGIYEAKLTELYSDSDEAGVDVAETWPQDFAGKNAATLAQGFKTAATKLGLEDDVDIMNRDDHVFILVKTRVAVMLTDEAAASTNGNGPDHSDDAEASDTVENGDNDLPADLA